MRVCSHRRQPIVVVSLKVIYSMIEVQQHSGRPRDHGLPWTEMRLVSLAYSASLDRHHCLKAKQTWIRPPSQMSYQRHGRKAAYTSATSTHLKSSHWPQKLTWRSPGGRRLMMMRLGLVLATKATLAPVWRTSASTCTPPWTNSNHQPRPSENRLLLAHRLWVLVRKSNWEPVPLVWSGREASRVPLSKLTLSKETLFRVTLSRVTL